MRIVHCALTMPKTVILHVFSAHSAVCKTRCPGDFGGGLLVQQCLKVRSYAFTLVLCSLGAA